MGTIRNAARAWSGSALASVAPWAVLATWPRVSGRAATRRRYTLSTSGALPVAHEFSGASRPGATVPPPVSPEWPMAMIPTGVRGAAESAVTVELAATKVVVAVAAAAGADVEDEVSALELPPHPERATAKTAIVLSLVPRAFAVSVQRWLPVRQGPLVRTCRMRRIMP